MVAVAAERTFGSQIVGLVKGREIRKKKTAKHFFFSEDLSILLRTNENDNT